ncbi:MAG: winged helix-turn-helix domain-containing protein [Actinomycetota bacterium]|nr:winged helix-turn-helix domain-containing protein [Actinomycetota bacterium]
MTAGHGGAAIGATVSRQGRVSVLCAQDVVVDLDAHLVRVGDRVVVMPHKELWLLAALVGSAGKVVARSQLSRDVWGSGAPSKSLDVHIRRLRRRIEPDPSRPRYIRTVRGFGYIFDVWPSHPADRHEVSVVRQLREGGREAC